MTLPKQMVAYRHRPTSNAICREIVPVPQPGPGQVLLEVLASGLCHSDVLILEHGTGYKMIDQGIFTQGHEFAGRVALVGPGAQAKVGELYTMAGTNPCMACQPCLSGRDNLCTTDRPHIGSGSDGGFAQYALVHQNALVAIPPGVLAEEAAAVADAMVTPYHATKTIGNLKAGQTFVVIGLGGLGLNACNIGRLLGANTFGVDVKPAAIELAQSMGIQALTMDALLDKVRAEKLSVDLVVDCFGSAKTFEDAQKLLGIGGTVVVCGLEQRQLPFSTLIGLTRELRAMNSYWGTKQELAELLSLIAQGKIKPTYKKAAMSTLPHWIEEMKAGRVVARMCFHPDEVVSA